MRSILPVETCSTRRPRQKLKAALVVAFLFVLAGTLAGCGSSSPGASAGEPPAASPAAGPGRSSRVTLSRRSRSHETQHRGVSLRQGRNAQASQ